MNNFVTEGGGIGQKSSFGLSFGSGKSNTIPKSHVLLVILIVRLLIFSLAILLVPLLFLRLPFALIYLPSLNLLLGMLSLLALFLLLLTCLLLLSSSSYRACSSPPQVATLRTRNCNAAPPLADQGGARPHLPKA